VARAARPAESRVISTLPGFTGTVAEYLPKLCRHEHNFNKSAAVQNLWNVPPVPGSPLP